MSWSIQTQALGLLLRGSHYSQPLDVALCHLQRPRIISTPASLERMARLDWTDIKFWSPQGNGGFTWVTETSGLAGVQCTDPAEGTAGSGARGRGWGGGWVLVGSFSSPLGYTDDKEFIRGVAFPFSIRPFMRSLLL